MKFNMFWHLFDSTSNKYLWQLCSNNWPLNANLPSLYSTRVHLNSLKTFHFKPKPSLSGLVSTRPILRHGTNQVIFARRLDDFNSQVSWHSLVFTSLWVVLISGSNQKILSIINNTRLFLNGIVYLSWPCIDGSIYLNSGSRTKTPAKSIHPHYLCWWFKIEQ